MIQKDWPRKIVSIILTALISLALLLGLLLITNFHNLGNLIKVIFLVETQYIDDVAADDLVQGAIEGLVDTLDDKYSYYLDQDLYEKTMQGITGSFNGIGVLVGESDDHVVIHKVYANTPAFQAGLQADDIILKIDNQDIAEMDINSAVTMMRGEAGTSVEVTVYRPANEETLTFAMQRASINVPTVEPEVIENGTIGYIRISQFTKITETDFNEALDKLTSQSVAGLIVDLRNNPGGSVDAVVKIADRFLSDGTIVTIEHRNGSKETYKADEQAVAMPLVVLINEGSASASEIFAGAMQDSGRGTLVGTKSFGKGIVQTIYPLGNNTGLKITMARYLTPDGNCIHEIGITPDVVLEYDDNGSGDNQLTEAIKILEESLKN